MQRLRTKKSGANTYQASSSREGVWESGQKFDNGKGCLSLAEERHCATQRYTMLGTAR